MPADWVRAVVAIPTGRWAARILILIWLVVAVVVTPLAGRLDSAQTNNAASFLPAGAESTKVINAQTRLPGGDAVPTVVVFHRAGGLTGADRSAIDGLRRPLSARAAAPVPAAVVSADGATAVLAVALPQNDNAQSFTDNVRAIRDQVRRAARDGLEVSVTGPGGLITDLYNAFLKLERTLLLVTGLVVAITLLAVYRGPFLWIVPLACVAIADQLAVGLIYLAARHLGLVVNGQSAGILRVLVFGAGTDYALLLIARYREELTRHLDPRVAMRVAINRAGPAIVASAATVIISLLCLLLGVLNSDRGLGPVGAIGIGSAFVVMMTLLPAGLVLFGRRLFWPFIPVYDGKLKTAGNAWSRVGAVIARRPRRSWIVTALLLAACAAGIAVLGPNLRQDQAFRSPVDSTRGIALVRAGFPAGATAPLFVISRDARADEVLAAVRRAPTVVAAGPTARGDGRTEFTVVLSATPDSADSYAAVGALREAVHAIRGADAIVGGNIAVNRDVADASIRDRWIVIPTVLAVVLLILCALLRAIVAPLLLIATVVVSFLSALGASALIFRHILGFPGSDPSLPLFGFIFLVALGIDYNIFLMTRVREEVRHRGARPGVLHGLAVTGGVITSAGVVLAATFSALLIAPIVQLAEIGFLVAFGVLLDTLIVRSILVPALAVDVGAAIWWPSRLGRGERTLARAGEKDGTSADGDLTAAAS